LPAESVSARPATSRTKPANPNLSGVESLSCTTSPRVDVPCEAVGVGDGTPSRVTSNGQKGFWLLGRICYQWVGMRGRCSRHRRERSMPLVTYIEFNGTTHQVDVPLGTSVMRGA